MRYELGNGVELLATLRGDRVHFTGSPTGDHSISADSSSGRVMAHWKGYLEIAINHYEAFVQRDR